MSEIISLVNSHAVTPPRAVLLFEDLLLQIAESRSPRTPLPPYCAESITKLAGRIRRTPEDSFNFAAEAAKCHITPAHFRRLFKQQLGLPPHQFLIYCRLGRLDLRTASGNVKLVNLASNIGALATSLAHGKVFLVLGLIGAISSIAGHYLGSGLAIKNGSRIVRPVILFVLAALAVKVITELI